jgi:hypothetical protein
MESQPIVVALRREKGLLEQVLSLALCQLDLAAAGRLDDLVRSSLVRSERMTDLGIIEAAVGARMPQIKKDLTVSPKEIAELQDLNLQIMGLVNRILEIDEKAQKFVDLADAPDAIETGIAANYANYAN